MLATNVATQRSRHQQRRCPPKQGETLKDIPPSLRDIEIASPDSTAGLCELFARIRNGEQGIRVSLLLCTGNQEYP